MGIGYVIFYTEASVICILILSILLIYDRIYSTLQEKQIWFNRALIALILYFLSDAFWAAVLGGVLPGSRRLIVLLNFTNYVLLSVMAYEVLMFIATSEQITFLKKRKYRRLYLLPMAVSILVILIAYAVKPYFWISEDGELNKLYYPLMISVPFIYLVNAVAFSLITVRKTESKDEKKQFWLLGMIPIGVMAFGIIQVAVLNAPTFCFGCTIMWLWFYIQNLHMMVSIDDLTRLNNRGQINRYMDQIRYRENADVYIMMIDIDRFKQINDTYGHTEGDRALILASEALMQTCERMRTPVFLGRYGGDEFIAIFQNPEENETPERTAEALRSLLTEKQKENRLPYDLEVSVGYDELRDRNDTMHDCMIRADEKLYAEKRAKNIER